MAKIVYGWVVDWRNFPHTQEFTPKNAKPSVSVDLFFSSKEKFAELLRYTKPEDEILIPVYVGDDFDDLDYIPLDY